MTTVFRYLAKMRVNCNHKLLIIGILAVLLGFSVHNAWGSGIAVKVIRVIDGDSLLVVEKKSGKKIEVRLWGVDAPEWGQSYSKVSRRFLSRKVLKKKCTLKKMGYDKYHRLLAIVYPGNGKDQESINGLVVKKGMAWVYTKYCERKICKKWQKFQNKAKRNKIGLWKVKRPVPPWKWRKSEYLKRR